MTHNTLTDMVAALLPDLIFSIPFLGTVDLKPIVTAAAIFCSLTIIFWLVRKVIIVRLTMVSHLTKTKSDDAVIEAIKSLHAGVYTLVALYLASQALVLPYWVDKTFAVIFYVTITWQVIRIVSRLVKHFTQAQLEHDEDGNIDPNEATAADMVSLLVKIALWILGGLFVLSNLGIEITSLIAGLGIGGIAVAFALQGILADLFASFSIYFDKPFRVGDFVVLGPDSGTVEKIGIKSTRIRTLQGEELVVSNAELTTARVQNFKKMLERRIVTTFGVTYETTPETLAEIKHIVHTIFEKIEKTRLDRVFFTTFGDSALIFEVVYFVGSSEYVDYLRVQEQFNLELFRQFGERGIEFAYPTQKIYTKSL